MIVTDKGIEMDPAKVSAIRSWEPPKTPKDLLAFLGYTGFYRRFIKGYSSIALPLTKRVKAKVVPNKKNPDGKGRTVYEPLVWDTECHAAFNALKDAF
jgi:hypothetical protein